MHSKLLHLKNFITEGKKTKYVTHRKKLLSFFLYPEHHWINIKRINNSGKYWFYNYDIIRDTISKNFYHNFLINLCYDKIFILGRKKNDKISH